MRRIHATCFAAVLAFAAASAGGQEMNDQDRAELRERAQRLQTQRTNDPGWDGGTRRVNESRGDLKLDQNRGDVKLDQNRGEVKARPTSRGKPKKDSVGRKMKRAAKTLPGALVRNR